MRYCVLLLAGLVFVSGCFRHPMNVRTNSSVSITGPVSANVVADLQPRRNVDSLIEMTVAGGDLPASCPKVVLLDIDGLLVNTNLVGPYSTGENPVDLLREKLDAIAADPKIRAVVVRINTPGGGVTASDVMWHELERLRTRAGVPVVAYLLELATGGGYYVATAADAIYAHPTTVTGGIGVILNLYNLQDTMAQLNVFSQPIKAGELIDMGTSARELTPQAKQLLQAMADEYHGRFREVVGNRRPGVKLDDPTNFDGRVFTATEARQRGLVDQVGYLEDAIAEAQSRAGLKQARVVMLHRPNDPARAPYAITANNPPQGKWSPVSIPGLERCRLPTFLYMWQIEPTLEKGSGQ
jgi:protease IV